MLMSEAPDFFIVPWPARRHIRAEQRRARPRAGHLGAAALYLHLGFFSSSRGVR